MIKLIAIDLDGTLLNSQDKISNECIKKLSVLHKHNIKIVLSTGRSFIGLPYQISQLECIDYLISSNGTSITEWRKTIPIYTNWLKAEVCAQIIKKLRNYECIIDILINGKWHIDFFSFLNYKTLFPLELQHYIETTRVFESDLNVCLNKCKNGVEKITISFNALDINTKIYIKKLEEQFPINVWSDKKHKLDLVANGVSKGEALKFLAKKLDIKQQEIMCFGNDTNDIEMFKNSGISVAVNNAIKDIKEIACYITASNNENGVLRFLDRYFDYKNEESMNKIFD